MIRFSVPTMLSCLLLLTASATAQDLFSGIDPDGFDKSVRPQDDLYQFVNGRWLLATQIPPDKSNYGSFTALDDAAKANVRTIIEEATKNPTNAEAQKVGDFYASFMNTALIEEKGLQPIQTELDAIDELQDLEAVFRHMGYLNSIGIGGAVGFGVGVDAKESTRHLAIIIQAGTSLPDRDFYLEEDPRYLSARDALKVYIAKLFKLAKLPDGDTAADNILELETKLAEIQWPRTELRNAEKRYNKYYVKDLATLTPDLPWSVFFEAAGVPDLAEINVMTPSFFEGLNELGGQLTLETAKQYMKFRVLDASADYLPQPFVDANFELYSKQLGGVQEQKPRWERGVNQTSGILGEALGKIYVQKHFKPEAKQKMDVLVQNLMKAYESSIGDLAWMSDATKERALEKLHKITPKIGYPNKWRDYSKLEIKSDDLLGNMKRAAMYEHARDLAKLGEPVDREEWAMTPQTVNAYYNPTKNEIVFPAAILQPPFFNADADDAANYGGIGAVIGHEISHGFDDQGSKYDGDGNLENWFTKEDLKAFQGLASKLVEQYEGYTVLGGKPLNGRLTLGENIADLSGMAIAYKAYILSLEGKDAPMIDGFTGPQRFFLGWSQIWRRLYRDEELDNRLTTDPHSPSLFRANGPVTNLNAFYEAFDLKPGDKLYKKPEDRIQIW